MLIYGSLLVAIVVLNSLSQDRLFRLRGAAVGPRGHREWIQGSGDSGSADVGDVLALPGVFLGLTWGELLVLDEYLCSGASYGFVRPCGGM